MSQRITSYKEHADDPSVRVYSLKSHEEHNKAPAVLENVPRGQRLHDEAPYSLLNDPGGHVWIEPPSQKEPSGATQPDCEVCDAVGVGATLRVPEGVAGMKSVAEGFDESLPGDETACDREETRLTAMLLVD